MKNIILKSFVGGLTFFFTIFLCIVGYATWMNLTEVQTTDTLTKDRWNEMVTKLNSVGSKVDNLSNIPSGFIGSFYLSSCPTGWKAADGTNGTPDLRGAFIRGINGNLNSRDIVRTLGSYQEDEFKSHNHDSIPSCAGCGGGLGTFFVNYTYNSGNNSYSFYTGNRGGTETRPKNVALLFCVKQ